MPEIETLSPGGNPYDDPWRWGAVGKSSLAPISPRRPDRVVRKEKERLYKQITRRTYNY